MPDRISVIEQYNNRDLIAQIYRIISLTESSTIVRVTTTQEGSHVTVTLEMYDGTSKTFTFDCVGDVTTDTVQNINALKNFMMGIGVVGPTHIDGDVRIVNGHYLQLAGDLDVGGDTELAGDLVVYGQSEISGMSIEESSGKTVLSNVLGISTTSSFEVPTTDAGERDSYAANGTRVQNDLDAYEAMIRTTGNQVKHGILQLDNIGKGTVALATNLNINNRVLKLGKASGYGVYRYGAAFFLVMCRDQLYLVRLASGSGDTIHNVVVTNLSTATVISDTSTLPFTLGFFEANEVFVVIKGTSGNKLVSVFWLGGSQGGSAGLSVFPTTNDEVTDEVTYFWTVRT